MYLGVGSIDDMQFFFLGRNRLSYQYWEMEWEAAYSHLTQQFVQYSFLSLPQLLANHLFHQVCY